MTALALVLLALWAGGMILEDFYNRRALASFRHVIHVSGIRGKTGVCRILDAGLRKAGYRVFTKTTGSDASYIDCGGTEHPIRRVSPANIGEQLKMIRRAYREHAEILVLECMAVDPQLQYVLQHRIVQADLCVITNVRYDHVLEMGESLNEIADSLAAIVPDKGVLFTADQDYFPFFRSECEKSGSECVLCTPDHCNENEAVARAVGRRLRIPEEYFSESSENYREDFGARHLYSLGDRQFVNLFSCNDPQSARLQLDRLLPGQKNFCFVYNHRSDRQDRLLLFAEYFFPQFPACKVVVTGDAHAAAARRLQRRGIAAESAKHWREAVARLTDDSPVLVGLGNIKGEGTDMITALEDGEGR